MQKSRYENSDENLYFCPECNRVWESIKKKKCTVIEYYEGFPSLGKKRIICSNCKVKKGLENVSLQSLQN